MIRLRISVITAFLAFASLEANAIDYASWSTENTKGTTYVAADGSFKTFARPDEVTQIDGSPRFNVLVNQESYVGLYCAQNEWGGTGNFGAVELRDGNPIEVCISCRKELGDYEILPHDADIYDVEKVTSKILKFKISKPNQNITLVLGGDYQKGDVLHLFCNNVDDEEPAVDETKKAAGGYFYDKGTKTYYFGPGYYDLATIYGGAITASGGRNIYISGGAVVNGQVCISGTSSKIYGHGIVMQSNSGASSELCAQNCTEGEVDGPIFYRYKVKGWQTTYTYCSNMNIHNIKVICVYGGSTDGMDFQGCHDLSFDNCFVRANDDCIAIKGLSDDTVDPQTEPAEKNLTFNKFQIWSSANGGFNIGAETRASVFENIKFTNSEVLYSFDGQGLNGSMDDRSALNICALNGTYFKDILYENIYVNRCERLIGAVFKDSFWYGTIQGNQSWNGEMQGLTYRNITCPYNTGGNISNDILFLGWHQDGEMEKYPDGTPDKFIHDITFENVVVEGEPVISEDNKHLFTNNTDDLKLVYDMHFSYEDGIKNINEDVNDNSNIYNIVGQRVNSSAKGLIIKNGRKYIIK